MAALNQKRILLGVSGSIAAYKALILVRTLTAAGADVKVILTEAAAKFVTPLSFQSLSHNPVLTHLWADAGNWSEHVQLGQWADAFVVAPCTANTIAKLATGQCEDMLSAVALTARCPIWIAPAMDAEMYDHPAVQHNLKALQSRGVQVIEPEVGALASGLVGKGRLAEPQTIFQTLEQHFAESGNAKLPAQWVGKRVLITLGATQEPLDPVRYISNHSTGKMGAALAYAALDAGAEVTMVCGAVHTTLPTQARRIDALTAEAMFNAVQAALPSADVFIACAAVADYRPAEYATQKIKKDPNHPNAEYVLRLVPNPDILAWAGHNRQPNQVIVGFALEIEDAQANALRKLTTKRADFIALNIATEAGSGFGTDTNRLTIYDAQGSSLALAPMPKAQAAKELLRYITPALNAVSHP